MLSTKLLTLGSVIIFFHPSRGKRESSFQSYYSAGFDCKRVTFHRDKGRDAKGRRPLCSQYKAAEKKEPAVRYS